MIILLNSMTYIYTEFSQIYIYIYILHSKYMSHTIQNEIINIILYILNTYSIKGNSSINT